MLLMAVTGLKLQKALVVDRLLGTVVVVVGSRVIVDK